MDDLHTSSPTTSQRFRSLLGERWSCRAYLPDEVPASVMEEMFALAQRTASWCNTQPWQVHVASGTVRDELASALLEAARGGVSVTDLPTPQLYLGVYRDRRREAGFALYDSLGIGKADSDARALQMLKNFEFFGAPHVAIVTTDREQGVYGAVDCGGYVANLVNAATSLGVATIPQAAIAMHSDVVREVLRIPEDRWVVCGVSFGYADLEHPVNAFRTSRASVDHAVTFLPDR